MNRKEVEKHFHRKLQIARKDAERFFKGKLDLAASRKNPKRIYKNVTPEWLADKFLENNGRCELTRQKLDIGPGKYKDPLNQNPFIASVDRIDSSKGYKRDNIQIICWMVNKLNLDLLEY